jgi:hypothetical protein
MCLLWSTKWAFISLNKEFFIVTAVKNSNPARVSRIPSSGILRHVALVRTDVSEEISVANIRVTKIGELRRFLQEPHGVTPQKTPFFSLSHVHKRYKSYCWCYKFCTVVYKVFGGVLHCCVDKKRQPSATRAKLSVATLSGSLFSDGWFRQSMYKSHGGRSGRRDLSEKLNLTPRTAALAKNRYGTDK